MINVCRHSRAKDFKNYRRVDTELAGGQIYQAIICNVCNREIGHTVHDPYMYIADPSRGDKDGN